MAAEDDGEIDPSNRTHTLASSLPDTDRLEAARMSLSAAVTRSQAARHPDDAEGRATSEHVFGAELKLRRGGRPDLARRLEATLAADLTTSAARTELREVAQLLDAELDPSVSDTPFVVASDGGERELAASICTCGRACSETTQTVSSWFTPSPSLMRGTRCMKPTRRLGGRFRATPPHQRPLSRTGVSPARLSSGSTPTTNTPLRARLIRSKSLDGKRSFCGVGHEHRPAPRRGDHA